ncbi:MAG: energy transducer TonB [Deltaproteobacteria bacterium]|nr:energy transducer TonB [Deltaproteobacteria bacterium]
MSAARGLFKTDRRIYHATVALILSLLVNVAIFAVAPVLLDKRVISKFSKHALLNLMMPLRPKTLEPDMDEPELPEELPQLELAPMETEMEKELPAPPEIAPPELEMPEMEVPPLRPPMPLDRSVPEAPTLEIDMKSLSASSVPLATNVPRTVANAPTMAQNTSSASNHQYSIGEVDSKPGALGQALPPYPRRARRRGIEGWVKVRFVVTKDGRVRNLRVLQESPSGVFHKTVMKTVPRWRFKPARKDGQPVDVWVEQTINFEMEKR